MRTKGDIFSGRSSCAPLLFCNVCYDRRCSLSDEPHSDSAPIETPAYDPASAAAARLFSSSLSGIRIIPLGSRDIAALSTKRKYRGLFHHVSVSQQASDVLKEDRLNAMLAEGATASVETAKFVFPLGGRDKRGEVEEGLRGMCGERGWEEIVAPKRKVELDEERDVLLFRCRK
uniref:Dynein assembly factor 3 C-terminal domain-containing protein n=1 Tax=Odontella aurita TaxID=265563 RepID=A0A7S4NEN8_9STRA|mmetsp:Transcript_61891/g.182826  ORF Transcript_61891/g.182826 Transcript_61891/m.182826 type:complete len:174 (+) Transcript_61891:1320-1841(+)